MSSNWARFSQNVTNLGPFKTSNLCKLKKSQICHILCQSGQIAAELYQPWMYVPMFPDGVAADDPAVPAYNDAVRTTRRHDWGVRHHCRQCARRLHRVWGESTQTRPVRFRPKLTQIGQIVEFFRSYFITFWLSELGSEKTWHMLFDCNTLAVVKINTTVDQNIKLKKTKKLLIGVGNYYQVKY